VRCSNFRVDVLAKPILCLHILLLGLGHNFILGRKQQFALRENGATPFSFPECDVQGGDSDQMEDADKPVGFLLGQLPVQSLKYGEDGIFALSWPCTTHGCMEGPQDLYPESISMYTLPTGATVKVPCSSTSDEVFDANLNLNCPAGFLPSEDPNNLIKCVKVCLKNLL
jgi:hypothetical protein